MGVLKNKVFLGNTQMTKKTTVKEKNGLKNKVSNFFKSLRKKFKIGV